jgi:hypothetical protein
MKTSLFLELEKNLNQLVRVYRLLFETVRKEKTILLNADLQALGEINHTKELLLKKINEIEKKWMAVAQDMQTHFGLQSMTPRLSDIAEVYTHREKEKLLRFRTVLNLLIARTATINKQNDQLAQSAISHISGAMQAFTETLNKKSNYEKKGKRSETSKETSGRLVSKEV